MIDIKDRAEDCVLPVRAQPGAKKTAIVPSEPPALNQTKPLTDARGNGDRLAAEVHGELPYPDHLHGHAAEAGREEQPEQIFLRGSIVRPQSVR